MNRKEKIWEYFKNHPQASEGLTTATVVDDLGILRTNVSKELNVLVREGKLSKLNGRPVRYCLAHARPQAPQIVNKPDVDVSVPLSDDVFDRLIGRKDSLKNQIEQAKAALLYPPNGLNVLITGPTGSGKTFFANAMYHFAYDKGILQKQGITVFNCADYAHNPQLLMSHLFGYVKGAFTGANEDKDGLIQEADGGMLFLDEVHRLPPEGQEMIFYFMDHGTYSRLGETGKQSKANVRLVCATTEDPESALLKTFVRRIPIVIQMPSFQQRTTRERLQLLKRLLTIEANRIQKNITLNEDVVQALLGSVTFGNVGQLKSNVQLVCAQGFLGSMQDENDITIQFEQLPPQIKEGLSRLASDRVEQGKLARLLEPLLVIRPDDSTNNLNDTDNYELPYNLYELIGKKAAVLQDEGLDQAAINNFIMTDINVHLKSFYRNVGLQKTETNFNEIVDQEIVDVTNEIEKVLKQKNYNINGNFLYAMSLHISSFIKRVQSGQPLRDVAENIVSMVQDYPNEFALAKQVKAILEAHYKFPVPDSETYYLAILLVSLKAAPKNGKVGIVVAAHGNSTAFSMVQVVKQLLDVDNLTSFDMSLEISPLTALNEIATKVKKIDRGNGVLLLVDMGSLGTFSAKLTEMTGIEVKTIDMVTTAMVLEAARKTSMIDSTLNSVYHELSEFSGYSRPFGHNEDRKETEVKISNANKPKAIIAICSTGEGTAKRIKEMLDEILIDNLLDDIEVIPISVVNMQQTIAQIQKEHYIVATTGIVNPQIDAPFISLENLLQGGGQQFVELLEEMDSNTLFVDTQDTQLATLSEQDVCQYLEQYFTFINPKKVIKILWNYCDFIERRTEILMTAPLRISLIMHLAGAIERYLTHTPITATSEELASLEDQNLAKVVLQANEILKDALNVELPLSEVYYIVRIFDTQATEN
ncbi:sigma-54-dependent transcriptional regulator [Ligilactobacillus sp. Marseille-Q7487]|jgi:transcriptional regulatory protein LevR/transcriptional regulator with AAA-type ATPase domain|uniref:sigma-54-dependent transcriptional regulator n=1 Tax=Ligilactobacillus sp. Marseille-Q7487 TaxID=3022128 RepID=UPI0015B61866|nr:sigma-54-dependent transcriptional regulator [Ligilactobacillus sp. Marseille-Q7487]